VPLGSRAVTNLFNLALARHPHDHRAECSRFICDRNNPFDDALVDHLFAGHLAEAQAQEHVFRSAAVEFLGLLHAGKSFVAFLNYDWVHVRKKKTDGGRRRKFVTTTRAFVPSIGRFDLVVTPPLSTGRESLQALSSTIFKVGKHLPCRALNDRLAIAV
jgi:hypothetical protein